MNAILGSGILGLAYAVKSLGILLYIVMLMGVAGMAFYAISLLLNICQITRYFALHRHADGRRWNGFLRDLTPPQHVSN